jgi:hypothetical protein
MIPVELIHAAKDWIDARSGDGTFECVYGFADGGGFSVGTADSADALQQQLLDYPLAPFMRFEVHPLVDVAPSFERFVSAAERMSQMAGAAG